MTISRTGSGPGLPAGFPFSLASEANGILFISGMPALDPDGTFVPKDGAPRFDSGWVATTALAGLESALGSRPAWAFDRAAEMATP